MKNLVFVFIIGLSSQLLAGEVNFSHWLEQEVVSHQSVLKEIEQDTRMNSNFVLNTIRVRVRATFKTEIPLVAKGKIRPEIELYFKK